MENNLPNSQNHLKRNATFGGVGDCADIAIRNTATHNAGYTEITTCAVIYGLPDCPLIIYAIYGQCAGKNMLAEVLSL